MVATGQRIGQFTREAALPSVFPSSFLLCVNFTTQNGCIFLQLVDFLILDYTLKSDLDQKRALGDAAVEGHSKFELVTRLNLLHAIKVEFVILVPEPASLAGV